MIQTSLRKQVKGGHDALVVLDHVKIPDSVHI